MNKMKFKCEVCGEPVKVWNLFAANHEHDECTVERITKELMEVVKKGLNKK